MRIVITAGPTHEYLDDVRFLGNPSTGAMGIAVANAARERGHTPVLVLGPTHLPDPAGVEVRRVVAARAMRDEVMAVFRDGIDAAVMSAAVSDYRPKDRVPGKWKKGADEVQLTLVKNPDILQELGTMLVGRPLIGFALEASDATEALIAARGKLTHKRCSLVVLNRPGSFGGDHGAEVTLVTQDAAVVLGDVSKRALAERLILHLEERAGERGGSDGFRPAG